MNLMKQLDNHGLIIPGQIALGIFFGFKTEEVVLFRRVQRHYMIQFPFYFSIHLKTQGIAP